MKVIFLGIMNKSRSSKACKNLSKTVHLFELMISHPFILGNSQNYMPPIATQILVIAKLNEKILF